MATTVSASLAGGGRCIASRYGGAFGRAAKKTTAAATSRVAGRRLRGRDSGPAAPRSTSPISPFAAADNDNDNDGGEKEEAEEDTAAPSPELARAQRALLWRHGGGKKKHENNNETNAENDATAAAQPLDVYTEALLVACSGGDSLSGGGVTSDDAVPSTVTADDAAAAAAAEGWSSADITSVLDHLAFDRLQVIMEKTEVSKGVEVMGMMRQVVVVGAGLDTRAFRMPWPRGTALFELAHRDVHQFGGAALRSVGAKPSRGCSHRRVPCDPTDATPGRYEYGDMEEAMLRAGYAPDVPSLWVLQDVGAMGDGDGGDGDGGDATGDRGVRRWLELAEEAADLMCAGSEVVGHVPTRRAWKSGGGGGGGGGGGKAAAFGAPLAQDMAAAGVLARSYRASELGIVSSGGEGEGGGGGGAGEKEEEQTGGGSGGDGEGERERAGKLGQLGVFHGVKQRPSKQEAEYYREQIYIAEFELGDDEGFED